MLVAVGGDVPSAAAAATLVPPEGENGLNMVDDESDCEPRRPVLGTATLEGLIGWLPGTLIGATILNASAFVNVWRCLLRCIHLVTYRSATWISSRSKEGRSSRTLSFI